MAAIDSIRGNPPPPTHTPAACARDLHERCRKGLRKNFDFESFVCSRLCTKYAAIELSRRGLRLRVD